MPPGNSPFAESRILLLRHAKTSAPDRFHGAESDIPLGPAGQQQAVMVARSLAQQKPTAIYSSNLLRARETAAPIALVCGLPLQIVVELHERKMGDLSGTLIAESQAKVDQTRQRWEAGNLDASHSGAESYAEIRDRVVPALRRIANSHRGETVIVVAHGVVIKVLVTTLLPTHSPADYDRVAIDHVAINDLRYDGVWWRAEQLGVLVD